MKSSVLPTVRGATHIVTDFYDALVYVLERDRKCRKLSLFFYAVTCSGWEAISTSVRKWCRRDNERAVTAYIGTDHGLTDPLALRQMIEFGVNVRLMLHHDGVYHPKAALFTGDNRHTLLVGSNNLTLDGLQFNVELGVLLHGGKVAGGVLAWVQEIEHASEIATDELLRSYEVERQSFGAARAKNKSPYTFVWSKKTGARTRQARRKHRIGGIGVERNGDLVVEIMNLETGTGGNQIQIPIEAAAPFFGLPDEQGASIDVRLRNRLTGAPRALTMTRYGNSTARLVISELQYEDRPCLVLFRHRSGNSFLFEIVRESLQPSKYRRLLAQCHRTREGSRAWTIL